METAIIYTRVSTEDQAQKGYSLRDQTAKLLKYCEDRGIKIVKHFEDDYSAKTFDRPEFQKLLGFVKHNKGMVNKLIVIKWDRFSRNLQEALNMISLLYQLGIVVDAIEQPLDDSIPESLLMKAMYLAAPQVENLRRSLNTKSGMRKALKEGRWLGHAPIGYRNGRDENNKPVLIKTEKADLILEAYKHYATGLYEKEQLRKLLKEKGLNLTKQSFCEMLNNPL
jgi:site-specific DNA recombinase